MFDIGWTELLVVAVVAILVVGPKELPRMLRTLGQYMGKMRRMAGEFQSTFNDAVREAERQADFDDIKKSVGDLKSIDPLKDIKDIKDTMNPLSAIDDVKDPTKSYKPTNKTADDAVPDPVDVAVAEMNPDDGLDNMDDDSVETVPESEPETVAAGEADTSTQKT